MRSDLVVGEKGRVSLWYELSLFQEGEFYALHSLQGTQQIQEVSLNTSRTQENGTETESLFLNLASLCLDVITVVIGNKEALGSSY